MQHKGLGKFIRNKRESLSPKISLNTFAFDNGIDSGMLSRIETEKQDIKYCILEKIAKGFNQKVSEFIAEFENSSFF